MGYLTTAKKTTDVSFENIDFDTPIVEAATMREEILKFFKENPDGEMNFQFGGFARLSPEFAKELFRDRALEPYLDKITHHGMHLFDGQQITEAIGS